MSALNTRKMPDQGRLVSTAGQLWLLSHGGERLTDVDLGGEEGHFLTWIDPGAEQRIVETIEARSAEIDQRLATSSSARRAATYPKAK